MKNLPLRALIAALSILLAAGRASAQQVQADTILLTSAYAEFQEREKGTLAQGKFADIAVLSQDIFTVPASDLPKTVSLLTMVGGKVIYTASDAKSAMKKETKMNRKVPSFPSPWGDQQERDRTCLKAISIDSTCRSSLRLIAPLALRPKNPLPASGRTIRCPRHVGTT